MAVRLLLFIILLALPARSAAAQSDLESEQRSLRGVSSFGVEVTVEGPRHLAESDQLDGRTIDDLVTSLLQDAGLPVRAGGDSDPSLHVHLNMMSLENGLVPFSAELTFRQAARLQRNDYRMTTATWNESVLGIVSYDLVATILSSVEELAAQFARDFNEANGGHHQ